MRHPRHLLFILLTASLLGAGEADAEIVINEIMYNSPGTDIEFVELYNAGGSSIDLTGWYMVDDDFLHPHCPLAGLLAPGEYLVVAADFDLFELQYPLVSNLNPFEFDPNGFGFALGNGGDAVNIHRADHSLADAVVYDDENGWPGAADGGGPSLELIYPLLDNGAHESWAASTQFWGTPGEINSVYQEDQTPICRNGYRNIPLPGHGDAVTILVTAFDFEALPSVELFVDTGLGYEARPMFDDGLHGDGAPGDSLWGAIIAPQASGTRVRYYAIATDALDQLDTWPGDAPAEYRAYTVDHVPPLLRITEILPNNVAGITDEFGQFDDWIEIRNLDQVAVDLGGMYLSDEAGRSHRWQLPEHSLVPGDFLVVWADAEPAQGPLHASFSLSAGGEYVGLFDTEDHGNVGISDFEFGLCAPDVAIGYLPMDASFPEYLATPTPGQDNTEAQLFSSICINEFLTTSLAGGEDDWIELFNRGDGSVDLSGWLLSDDRNPNDKWAFPQGSVLAPGEFMVVAESVLGFGISSSGNEVIMLTAADSTTGMDFYDPGPQAPDTTLGRSPDGAAYWTRFPVPTPGASNAYPTAVPSGSVTASALRLLGSHPNPFNPATTVSFELAESAELCLRVFDARGRMLREIWRGPLPAGRHAVEWDGRDASGARLASGTYFLRVQAGREAAGSKLILLK